MPTVEQNRTHWSKYAWEEHGDEWSAPWGGTAYVWYGTIFPRILPYVPTRTILEIGAGHGRCTQYLKGLCDHLVVVDVAQPCIDACKARFADDRNISYHVNDGKSLAFLPDASVDFAFSWDSLVHADASAVRALVASLGTKLTADGVGLLHHSNLGAFVRPDGTWPPALDTHWRSDDVTATLFADLCAEAGLQCIAQELINWGGTHLLDCISLFTRTGSRCARPNRVVENHLFTAEVARCATLASLYACGDLR